MDVLPIVPLFFITLRMCILAIVIWCELEDDVGDALITMGLGVVSCIFLSILMVVAFHSLIATGILLAIWAIIEYIKHKMRIKL
jgi:uncharacterized membrane protein HdeD (DUF308 family)